MARVLVIDMRRVVDGMLKNAGHDTAMAVDGTDGLRQFGQQRFDLVICDIFMPNLDGIATLRELRRLDAALPVIMMSGGAPSTFIWETAHVDYLAMAQDLGATRTIEKPFRYSQLMRLVREFLAAS